MKILYITTHLNRGGIVSYLSSLAISLRQRGHTIIVASSGGDIEELLMQNGIKHLHIPIRTKNEISPHLLFSYYILRKYLVNNSVDIIHAHTRVTQVLATFLARRFRMPMITTCHGFFKPRWFRQKFPCWGDKVIAISSQVKNHLISDFKVKKEDIYLIHNGVDLTKFKEHAQEEINQIKQEIGIPQNYFVVGTAARFSVVKGLEYLLKAIPHVLEKKQQVSFVLVGYGRQESKLRQISNELNIEEKVIFYKPQKEISQYLCVMDIFVMPSIQEGLGLSILEAQAQKIPVIASCVGGIPDIIQNYQTGILVNPKDALAISSAILKLMQDKELYNLLKNNAYQRLIDKFSLPKMVEETDKAYKDLLCHLE